MRQILLAITLCLFPLVPMAAEKVDLRRELTPFAVGQLEDREWDFTKLSTVDDASTAYTAFKAGVYYESTGPSCRAYAQCGDTLVYRGYNTGRHEKMLLDMSAPSRVTRGDRGRAFNSSFSGRGLLYGEYVTSEAGTLSSEGCGYGRLVLYGDTVAAYLHRETISTSKFVEGDSAAVAGRITIYRWLLDGGMCPVAVQTESDDGRSSLFAVDEFRAKELISNTAKPAETPDDEAVMAVLESAYGRRTPAGVEVGFRAGADMDTPPLPMDVGTPQKALYYDSYDFLGSVTDSLPAVTRSQRVIGLLTGERDYAATSAKTLTTAYGYNAEGRVAEKSEQTLNGAVHTAYTYDRRGNVLTERSVHTPRGQEPIVREVTTAYNAAGRVARRRVTENGSEAEMSFTYDDCGRLASERMSNGVTRRYTYNIYGWPELTETVVPVELQADKDSVVQILPPLSPSYYRRIIGGIDTAHVEPFNPPPSVKPIAFTKTYTDRLLYTDGAHPRYGGSPSARINSLGGRYDYSYDPHDRLLRAYYTPGEKAAEGEDFTVTYSYDELSRPTDVDRSGVVSVDADGVETFGMLDELTYRYGESGALESIDGTHEGEDYYGRPGYPATDGTYTWNKAGCMKSDSSRGISNITYDYRNLPTGVEFEDGSKLQHHYNAEGVLLRSIVRRRGTGVGLIGSTMKTVSSRDYIGDRVFNKGKLEYSYFPGGYFDGTGGVHYLHSDYQGSVVMVTDSIGRVEQHNTYYPYGEPHRLPSGQRRLYCGKERESVTGEYDYGARLHFAPGLLWTVPDALADLAPQYSPYVFCAANPVRYIDENGMKWNDPKVEEDLLNLIEKCFNNLQKKIEKEKVKVEELESKGKDTTKSMDKIDDFNNRIDYLNRNKDNVKRLGMDQDNTYAIGRTAGDGVNIVRKDEDGKVVIQADGTARILHEITHIVQSLDTGGLLFSNNSILCNAGITYSENEKENKIAEYEVEAYRNQYAYDPYSLLKLPQSLNHINQEYVSSIIVNGRPAYPRIADHTRRLKKGSDK